VSIGRLARHGTIVIDSTIDEYDFRHVCTPKRGVLYCEYKLRNFEQFLKCQSIVFPRLTLACDKSSVVNFWSFVFTKYSSYRF